jgi:cyclophilin family peptidyl-prolyl cis-trans isomerase
MIDRYRVSDNTFEKAMLLEGLGYYPWNYGTLLQELFPDSTTTIGKPSLLTAGVQGIIHILNDPNLQITTGMSYNKVRTDLLKALERAFKTQDVGVVTLIAEELYSKDASPLLETFMDYTILLRVRNSLNLPNDIEGFLALNKAIEKLSKQKQEWKSDKRLYNPITWSELLALPPHAQAFVQTSRGNFTFELMPADAPASVLMFIQLARKGEYNGVTFHRVAPNHVIQVGCKRGDGYSSYEKLIRTEISDLRYDREGWVGLAHADAMDTESAQWFVTHCPTPHLDGKFTIFGKIKDGMSVVHNIEVGDKIINIEIR